MQPNGSALDSVRAFLDNEDSPDIRNPIHSTAVAQAFGFSGPLVGGVTVWSWCTPAILQLLGDAWLDHGWGTFRFRRPTYPGDDLAIRVEAGSPRTLRMTNQAGVDCVVGELGLGDAPWLNELERPTTPLTPAEVPTPPSLTRESAPVGRDWAPVMDVLTDVDHAAYLRESHPHRNGDDPFQAPGARIHPGWIADRAERIMRHNQHVPSSIHVQSRLQFLAPALAGGIMITGARVRRIFERKGHHGVVFDVLITDAEGAPVAQIEHTTIFRIARPDERPVGASRA